MNVTLTPIKDLLDNEDIYYKTEYFQDASSLTNLVECLEEHSITDVFVTIEDELWDGQLYFKCPETFSPELFVIICSYRPDSVIFETVDDTKYIVLWWD